MDLDIFDRLAAMRVAADARAQRIHVRGIALKARRGELSARMHAIRQVTVSPAPAGDAELNGAESIVSVSTVA